MRVVPQGASETSVLLGSLLPRESGSLSTFPAPAVASGDPSKAPRWDPQSSEDSLGIFPQGLRQPWTAALSLFADVPPCPARGMCGWQTWSIRGLPWRSASLGLSV